MGSNWDGFFGAPYFEVWSVSFETPRDIIIESWPLPVPAAAWLFGTGLLAMTGVARRKRRTPDRRVNE